MGQHFVLAFNGLPCQKISTTRSVSLCGVDIFELKFRISPRKRFFKRNHFNLFIRGPDGLDKRHKKMLNNLVTLPL